MLHRYRNRGLSATERQPGFLLYSFKLNLYCAFRLHIVKMNNNKISGFKYI